jgi:UDP-glucose 4-epimerase
MRVVITGAQGFVGRYLTDAFLRERPKSEVLGIARSPRMDGYFSHTVTVDGTAMQAPVPPDLLKLSGPRYRYERMCLTDTDGLKKLMAEFLPDVVVHLASGLRGDDWRTLIESNVMGTASLLRALGETCVTAPAVILGSTGGVYGAKAADQLPATEESPCNPADVYSATKLSAEQIGRVVCAEYNMRLAVARIFNVCGPGQSERHVCGRFARLIIGAARSGSSVLQTGDLTATRDYIDVRDAAAALLLLAQCGEGTYNVASGIETATGTVLDVLLRQAGLEHEVRIERTSGIVAGVPRHFGSISRLLAAGYAPAFPLETTLQHILSYYMSARKCYGMKT